MPFHLEIASREFEQEVGKLLSKFQDKIVRDKLLGVLQKWANNEFRTDPQLNLIPSLVNTLKSKGVEFPNESPKSPKSLADIIITTRAAGIHQHLLRKMRI